MLKGNDGKRSAGDGGTRRRLGLRAWRQLTGFIHLLSRRFIENQGLPNAASLTFNTLLSLVPLMTVSLAVFAAFPVSERVVDEIQDFVFNNFVPASGEVLQSHLQEFSRKASSLSGTGFVFLIIVALMMMGNIDSAFNTIWRVRRKRSTLNKFMVYWSILSLGPLLIGVSVAVTSYLVSMPLFTEAQDTYGLGQRLFGMTPLLASAVAFTLLYVIVPNRRVPIRHACAGGLLAALLFELAKRGFALYITQFPAYEAIYGALAVMPIFLVWVYLSWVVTLLGAEFTYCLGIYHGTSPGGEGECGGEFLLAYRLLHRLWRAQRSGRALSTATLSRQLCRLPEERLENLLDQLKSARLVLNAEDGGWLLSRDLSDVTLLEFHRALPYVLPDPTLLAAADEPAERALGLLLQPAVDGFSERICVPLNGLFGQAAAEDG